MPDSPRERLFGSGNDEVDPSQSVRRDGERSAPTRAELPQARRLQSRREHRARADAQREAQALRPAGASEVDYNPNKRRGLVTLALALVLVVAAGSFAWRTLGLSLPSFSSSGGDYSGTGENETAEVKINKGDAGSTIGSALVAAGVTKSTSALSLIHI